MESPKKSEANVIAPEEKVSEIVPKKSEEAATEADENAAKEKMEVETGEMKSDESASVEETATKESPAKEEDKKTQSTKGSPVKESPVKKENKKKGEKEGNVEATEQEEEEENEEHEQKKGIFDMPLEVEGKRERHKVERISIGTPTAKKTATEIKMGNGVPLGEIAYIEDQLKKHSAVELQNIHRLIYGHVGKASTIRREIRKFTGFAFEENTPEFKHKVAYLQKLTLDQLKIMKKILGVQSGGNTKDALVTTIMVFMMKTVDHERKVPGKKRKSTAKTPGSAKKARRSKASDEVIDDDDDDDEEEEKKEEDEEKKKKEGKKEKTSAKAPKTPATAKKQKKKKESEVKDASSKTDSDDDSGPAKKKSKKVSKKDSDDDSSDTSEETSQENSPSEKELETVIEELLATFDLAQVSMKQMCQAVIERFPGTNIATRIDFLKSKIKQCLSTK
ncbi:unnamed protein product [Strongylus vulgaris]|uniref:DEK-C domain-containing protein n=1 Tax=Strongylus vulgaris TaxID=40348 RepID=A0A3P7KIN0_STRVU|nr:unnamed protein product [Strongylus vulgaris]